MSNVEMLAESCGYVLFRNEDGTFGIENPGNDAPELMIEENNGKFISVIQVEEMTMTEMYFAEKYVQLLNRAVNTMYIFNNTLKREQNNS